MTDNRMKDREVLLEFIPMGSIVKVTAFDTASMTEISIQGPRSAGEEILKRNALNRLEYVMRKNKLID